MWLVLMNENALMKPFKYNTKCEYSLIDINDDVDNVNNKDALEYESYSDNVYVSQRNEIIAYLQTMCVNFNYTDRIFYKTLLYLDYIFANNTQLNNSVNSIKLLSVSILLLIAKFHGLNTYMPNLHLVPSFTLKQIKLSEVHALQLLQYNLSKMSVYDYLTLMFYNGIVFANEHVSNESIIMLYRYIRNVLAHITQSCLLMKYHPKTIAFAIVLHARNKQFQFTLIKENTLLLENIYKCKRNSYLRCYKELINLIGVCDCIEVIDVLTQVKMKVKSSCNVFTKVVKCWKKKNMNMLSLRYGVMDFGFYRYKC